MIRILANWKRKLETAYTLAEVHQYVQDIQAITKLRDTSEGNEQMQYSTAIEVMQEVLVHISDHMLPNKKIKQKEGLQNGTTSNR